jgi:2-amino-4-hydroxy-6-hydroxymethyldihydropteridine diphosphokinase
MARVYIGLGSNLGDRINYIKEAIASICKQPGIEAVGLSSVYETEPVGKTDQPGFLNCVLAVETGLSPRELLKTMGGIESKLKRERSVHWGPRTIDIDILLYGDYSIKEPDLIIPHPRMCERAFVIVPLMELSHDIVIPGVGKASRCKKQIADQSINKLAVLDIDDIISK